MAIQVRKNLKNSLVFFILLFLFFLFPALSLANAVNVSGEVVVFSTSAPLVPTLGNVPEVACGNFLSFSGVADPNVDIYVNDVHKTTTDNIGEFIVVFILDEYTNVFEVKVENGGLFSPIATYTITKSDCTSGSNPNIFPFNDVHAYYNGISIEETVDYIEEEELDSYIADSLTIDEALEPLVDDAGESPSSSIRDAISEGITTTYEDFDEDGLSDVLELVLDLDIDTPDTDSDGVADAEEIVLSQQFNVGDYLVALSLADDYQFTCNDFFVYGRVVHMSDGAQTSESASGVKVCFEGKDDEESCFDIEIEKDGSFHQELHPVMKPGQYKVNFVALGEVLRQYNVSCKDSDGISDVLLTKIDRRNVYIADGTRFKKRKFIFSLTNRPKVRGFASVHDLVFVFWVQDNGVASLHSLAMSDVNGYFEAIPSGKLKTFLGFAINRVYVYAYDGGVVTAVDVVRFYVFDILIIAIEILLLLLLYRYIRRWYLYYKQ